MEGEATYSLAFYSTNWKLSTQGTNWLLHLWEIIWPHPSKSTCLKEKFSSKLLWNIGTISKRKDMLGLNWAPTSPSPNEPKGPAQICCTSMAPVAASAKTIFSRCGVTFLDFWLFSPPHLPRVCSSQRAKRSKGKSLTGQLHHPLLFSFLLLWVDTGSFGSFEL